MKKIILLISILLLCVLIFTACSDVKDTTADSSSTASQSDTLTQDTTLNVMQDGKENIGGYTPCPVHHQTYHDIPMSLIKYIGEDEFFKWTELEEKEELPDGCSDNKTIYDCIRYFNVPREVLEKIYYDWSWYTGVWNLDALCEKEKSPSDEFYRNSIEFDTIILKRNALMDLKQIIARDNWDEWTSLYGNTVPTPQHSVKYLVELFDIPKEKLEEYTSKVKAEDTYKYDVDVLYSLVNGDIKIDNPTPIKEDALFCGFEDLYIE